MHILQDCVRQEGVYAQAGCYSAMDAQGAVSSRVLVKINTIVIDLEESCCVFPVPLHLETGKLQSLPFTP